MTRLVAKPHQVYWTDGSCHPNPGPGGFAVVRGGKLVASGYETLSTNQRMELSAIHAALCLIAIVRQEYPRRHAEIRSDSQYSLSCVQSVATWANRGWRRVNNAPLKNLDIIKRIWDVYHDLDQVTLTHVRGHAGIIGNEMADHYAALARLEGIVEGGRDCSR